MTRHRPLGLGLGFVIAVVLTVAAGTAGAGLSQTPVETGCPAGYERLAVASLEAQGPHILPRLVDTEGNNNGYVCGLVLPRQSGMRSAGHSVGQRARFSSWDRPSTTSRTTTIRRPGDEAGELGTTKGAS